MDEKLTIGVDLDGVIARGRPSHSRETLPVKGSKEALGRLSYLHDLILITERGNEEEQDTLNWIEKHIGEQVIANAVFCNYAGTNREYIPKTAVALALGIDVHIDDNITIAQSISKLGRLSILFSDTQSPREEEKNIVLAHDWQDVENIIYEQFTKV